MDNYPLIFTFRDFVAGKGFLAHVTMEGYVLLEEDEMCWMHGVQPGCLTGGGPNRDAAFQVFKNTYLTILFDVAEEASDFDAFKSELRSLLKQVNVPFERDWMEARERVRAGGLELEGLPIRKTEKTHPRIFVNLVTSHKAKPSRNALPTLSQAA